jgi:hypothetical protein
VVSKGLSSWSSRISSGADMSSSAAPAPSPAHQHHRSRSCLPELEVVGLQAVGRAATSGGKHRY